MAEGLDRLIDVLRAPPKVSPTIGAQQTPRTFRLGVVTVTSPLTVTLNNDPLAAVQLPYLDSVSGGGGGGGPGSGAGLVIDRGWNRLATVTTATGICTGTDRDFTPADGSVLVALVTHRAEPPGILDLDISDSFGDVGWPSANPWTLQVSDNTAFSGSPFFPTETSIWTRQISTGATPGDINACTLFDTADVHRAISAAFLEIPAATSAVPVQTAHNGGITDGTSNTITVTFPAAPFSASVVAAMVMVESGHVQPLAPAMTRIESLLIGNYATDEKFELADRKFDTTNGIEPDSVTWQAYNVGGAGQSMTFVGSLFATGIQGCAIEIPMGAAAPGGGGSLTVGDLVLVGVFEGGAMVVLGRIHLP